jgi:toxin ParE1/3/4
MRYSVRFHPDAEVEMNEAAEFLDLECAGLGEDFLDDLQHALDLVGSNPGIAPVAKGRARKKVLRKFPYSIIYSAVGTEIRILAVMHHRRRPFYWHRRK